MARWFEGERIGWMASAGEMTRDITWPERTQEALQQSQFLFQAFFEQSQLGVAITDSFTGRFLQINVKYCEIAGRTQAEMLATDFQRITHPDDLEASAQAMTHMLQGENVSLEKRYVRPDGSSVWVSLRLVPMWATKDAAHVHLAMAEDITERKQAEVERARLAAIVNFSNDAIIGTIDGIITSWNAAAQRLYGYTAAEAIGLPLTVLVPSDQAAALADIVQRVQRGERIEAHETVRLHKDGTLIPVALTVSPIRDAAGTFVGTSGISRDISERLQAEAARREQAALAEALARVGREVVSSLETPVLLERLCRVTTEVLACDFSHTLLWDREEEAFVIAAGHGDSRQQWETIRLLKFPPGLVAPISALERDAVVEIGAAERPSNPQFGAFMEAHGVTLAVYLPLRRHEQVIGLHVAGYRQRLERLSELERRVVRGIAQLASMALVNAELFAELDRANRLKSEFVSTVSHELRTPLNIVLGYLELLLNGEFGGLAADQQEVVQRASRAATRLHRLIESMLDLSRLDARQTAVNIETVDVEALIEEVANETRRTHGKSTVRLVHDRTSVPPLRTDALKLRIVVTNLLENAMKFTDEGTVTIATRCRDGGVEISVSDTGIGIDPSSREFIFEAFRQGETAAARRFEGAGLGLYIVRRFVEILGGTIALDSEVGRGSTFRIWIPGAA